MTDQVQAPAETEGQPVPEAPAEAAATPEYVTRQDLDQMYARAVEDAFRRAQSYADKSTGSRLAAVEQSVQRFVENAQSLGMQLTAGQVQALRNSEMTRAMSQPEASGQPAQPPAGQPGSQMPDPAIAAQQQVVAAAISQLHKAYGVTLEQTDPEANAVKGGRYNTAEEFLEAYRQATEAKRNRLNRSSPQARTPAQVTGGPAPDKIGELTDKLNALMKDPSKNAAEIMKTQRELEGFLPKR